MIIKRGRPASTQPFHLLYFNSGSYFLQPNPPVDARHTPLNDFTCPEPFALNLRILWLIGFPSTALDQVKLSFPKEVRP